VFVLFFVTLHEEPAQQEPWVQARSPGGGNRRREGGDRKQEVLVSQGLRPINDKGEEGEVNAVRQ